MTERSKLPDSIHGGDADMRLRRGLRIAVAVAAIFAALGLTASVLNGRAATLLFLLSGFSLAVAAPIFNAVGFGRNKTLANKRGGMYLIPGLTRPDWLSDSRLFIGFAAALVASIIYFILLRISEPPGVGFILGVGILALAWTFLIAFSRSDEIR